jgi:hypothetical protein
VPVNHRFVFCQINAKGLVGSYISLDPLNIRTKLLIDCNYSPPFWEILLDTVTAESPTGEG